MEENILLIFQKSYVRLQIQTLVSSCFMIQIRFILIQRVINSNRCSNKEGQGSYLWELKQTIVREKRLESLKYKFNCVSHE